MKNEMAKASAVVPSDIRPLIYEIRGVQVMLDRDLAAIYHVMTGRLNEAVKRNSERFPSDFMFQLDEREMDELIANCDRFRVMKHSPSRMEVFVIGASLKDAARQTFSATRIGPELIPCLLDSLRKSAAACVEYGGAKPAKKGK